FSASDDFNASPFYGYSLNNGIDGDIRNVLFDTRFSAYPFPVWAAAVLLDPSPNWNMKFGIFQTSKDMKNAELHVPIGRGIEQDRRRPNWERISGEACIEEHISDVAVDAVVQRVAVERRGIEVIRRAEAAKLQPDFVVRQLLLQEDLIQKRPLPSDHLLHRVDAANVLSRQVLAGAIDPAHHEQSALPADELLEIKLQTHECIIHDRGVTGMNSAAHVAIEDAVIEREHLQSGGEKAFPQPAPDARHVIGGDEPARLLDLRLLLRLQDRPVRARDRNRVLPKSCAGQSENNHTRAE